MTVTQIANKLNANVIHDGGVETEGVYVGDFLSRVMGKAPAKCAWLTIMSNVNVAGVATLADIAAVVLCEGVTPDDNLVARCKQENITLITTKLDVYAACVALAQ